MRGNALVVGASRSLVTTSEQDARTTSTHQNLCGELLLTYYLLPILALKILISKNKVFNPKNILLHSPGLFFRLI